MAMIKMQNGRFIPWPSVAAAESFVNHYPEQCKPCVITNDDGKIVRRFPIEPPPKQLPLFEPIKKIEE